MAREGRDFKQLIEKLEKILLPEKAIIRSPDFIEDKITGQKREVDISIRMDIGSVPILILVECRDRKADQDTTWIEQIHTKTNDLNANKVIAVSSSGFSDNAVTKASHYGIETRTYGEISSEEIRDWCKIEFITMHNQQHLIHHVQLDLPTSTPLAHNPIEGITVGDLELTRTKDKSKVNLQSIFEGEIQTHNIWDSIPIDNWSFRAN